MRVITEGGVRKFIASNCANCLASCEIKGSFTTVWVCRATAEEREIDVYYTEPPKFCPLLSGTITLEVRAGGSTQPVEVERVQ